MVKSQIIDKLKVGRLCASGGTEYKGMLSLVKDKITHIGNDGKLVKNNGITNPINGKALISKALTNYGLASTFIHEMVHSIDFMTGVQRFWNHFPNIGNDFIEARAYLEVAKWEGGVYSSDGTNHIIRSMSIILSTFNLVR